MTKPFQAGHAAENGTVAADLAALGWTAAPNILEARFGWFNAAGGGYAANAIRAGWARRGLRRPGGLHQAVPLRLPGDPAMWEFLDLVKRNDIKPDQVDRIDMGGNSKMISTLLHHRPKNGLRAKLGMEFALAILLLERKAGLAQVPGRGGAAPDVQEWIRRVNYYVDPVAEAAGLRPDDQPHQDPYEGRPGGHRPGGHGQGQSGQSHVVQESSASSGSAPDFAKWPASRARSHHRSGRGAGTAAGHRPVDGGADGLSVLVQAWLEAEGDLPARFTSPDSARTNTRPTLRFPWPPDRAPQGANPPPTPGHPPFPR